MTSPDDADARFQAAERALLAQLDRESLVADPARAIQLLRELIDLYERRASHFHAEERARWRRQRQEDERRATDLDDLHRIGMERNGRDAESRRANGQAIRRLHRQQLACYKRLLGCQERRAGRRHPDVADALLALARHHWRHFSEFDAFPLERRALAIRERALGADHPDTLVLVRQLAHGYSTLMNHRAAIPLWRRRLIHVERGVAADPAGRVDPIRGVLSELGEAYNALPDPVAAEETWRRFLALPLSDEAYWTLLLNRLGDNHPAWPGPADNQQLYGLYGVGRACAAQGKWAEAELFLREALALHERYPDHALNENGGATQLGLDAGLQRYALGSV